MKISLPVKFRVAQSTKVSISTCFSSLFNVSTSQKFLPASIELFNSLPASVSSCSSRDSFLFALDRHFSKDIISFGLT